MADQLLYRRSLIGMSIIIMLEQLNEYPLCPVIIVGIAGAHLARPVEGKTDFIQLFAITAYIIFGGYGGMLSGLDSILLCRESECIVSHRVENIKAIEALIP